MWFRKSLCFHFRLERERKKQLELEKQMEKQRAIEREREEQRQKMMEQREVCLSVYMSVSTTDVTLTNLFSNEVATCVICYRVSVYLQAARRELERQRQMEWERQRKEQLMAEKVREYQELETIKSQNANIKCELEALVRDL